MKKYVMIACNPDGTVEVLEWFEDLAKAKETINDFRKRELEDWVQDGGEYLLLERITEKKKKVSE
jgi:hypothetical protein